MNHRTITGLLAAIAVLLTFNLIAKSSPAMAQTYAGPTQPTVVAGHVEMVSSNVFRFFRFWSDGVVDTAIQSVTDQGTCELISFSCGPTVLISGSCAADVTRNGEVEVADLLDVLGQWGPCPPK